jgi:FKBP-type peptidyl-prolyl cis-trans isomerase
MRAPSALLLVLLMACGGERQPPPAVVGQPHAAPDTHVMDENKRMAQREESDIQDWMRRQQADMVSTGTGLRYKLVRDVPGDTAKPEQVAVVNFAVFLLNGDTCYVSEPGRPGRFRIEHSDVESGLQEGIQHLSPGDSAIMVIPSALAFGLLGDRNKIPMRSTVVYHIGLVSLKK